MQYIISYMLKGDEGTTMGKHCLVASELTEDIMGEIKEDIARYREVEQDKVVITNVASYEEGVDILAIAQGGENNGRN